MFLIRTSALFLLISQTVPQELISQSNNRIPSTGEAIRAAYNQALEEGFAPRDAKYILYNNAVSLNKRTIRRYLPLEARDTEKIRNKNHAADNDPQVSAEKGPPLSHQASEGEIIASTISNEESGYDHGCEDSELDPEDRYINEPGKGAAYHTDEFMDGYMEGYDKCKNELDTEGSTSAGPRGSVSGDE
jgi:hypothetical protein